VNGFARARKVGKDQEVGGEVLAFLGKYAVEHFGMEDGLLRKQGYPGYAEHKGCTEHKAIHEVFQKDFGALAPQFDAAPKILSPTIDVQRRVTDCLKAHILGTDAKLGPFLTERGVR